jgi:hypothetical protein
LCMHPLLTTKRHFTIALRMPVRLSASTPVSLNGCGGPRRDESRCVLNLMKYILIIYYECILSDITHKLNVSGHILTLIIFLVFVCGTRAQILSITFSYTLYNNSSVTTLMHWNSTPGNGYRLLLPWDWGLSGWECTHSSASRV